MNSDIDIIFTKLVIELKKKFKGNIYDNFAGYNLGSSRIRYIASLKHLGLLNELKSLLRGREGLTLTDLNTPYFQSVYIESVYGFNILILSVHDEYNTLEPSTLNYGTDSNISNALQKAVSDLKLDSLINYSFDTTANIITAVDLNIAYSHNLSIEDYYNMQASNTQKEFVKVYNLLRTNNLNIDNINMYNHIHEFAFLYYAVINVMADIFKSNPLDSGFTIHDAGASSSQLSIMLSTLTEEELMGLKVRNIIASDLAFMDNNSAALSYLKQFGYCKPIKFIEQDYTDESKELFPSDVTILVDVLEHFPDDEVSFHVLQRLLDCTGKLLIAHVPQEEVPNPAWGHYISFNRPKLVEWAGRFSSHESLGDFYRFKDGLTYTDKGFLILKRKC